jgi:flagellar hook-length control protein FliK
VFIDSASYPKWIKSRLEHGAEPQVAQVARTSAASDPRRPESRMRLDMHTAMPPEQVDGDAPQTPPGTFRESSARPVPQAVTEPMAAYTAETLSTPQVPAAETRRSAASVPLASGRIEGTLTGETAHAFPAPEERQPLTSREGPHTSATEGQVQSQQADASLPSGEKGRSSMGHAQPEVLKAQGSRAAQTALPEGDFGGLMEAHVNERAVLPTRVDAGPVITHEKQTAQDVPRALPLSPENAGRLLGHPLSHGTVLLQLHPPEPGYMQVQVQLHDHQLAATFWADSPEVRPLIQTHLPTLQQNLHSQRFAEHQVSTTLAGGEFTGQAGQFAQQHTASQSFAQHREPGTPMERSSRADSEPGAYRSIARNGLVDVVI